VSRIDRGMASVALARDQQRERVLREEVERAAILRQVEEADAEVRKRMEERRRERPARRKNGPPVRSGTAAS
jgi:hypothetical protein